MFLNKTYNSTTSLNEEFIIVIVIFVENVFFHQNLTSFLLKLSAECSVAEPEPPGATTFRAVPEPELIFFGRSREPELHFLRRLRLHLLGMQKRKALFLC